MHTRWSRSLALVGLLAVPSAPRTAASQAETSLATRLNALIDDAALGDAVGVHVVRADDASPLFARHAQSPRNPASNVKLVTVAAALLTLGPDFSMRTALMGNPEETRVDPLILRGFGDPSLRLNSLTELAQGLANRGIDEAGTIVVDGSYFDDEFLPPAFEQQPNELAAFRAAIAAVSVERSAYVLRVLPSDEVGQPADVRLSVPEYFRTTGTIQTSPSTARANVIVDHEDGDGTMTLRLSGTVPVGAREVAYRLRVNHPLYFAGHALIGALRRAGITTEGTVRVERVSGSYRVLTQLRSEPLANLVDALGKRSDNFTAEMLLKVMGAEERQPGTTAQGLSVVRRRLTEMDVDPSELELVNGSGLFEGNRIAPAHLTQILHRMYVNPSVRSEFVTHLATPGETGTLARRLTDVSDSRTIRAKTGTLRDAVALSGYVLRSPEPALAFSILLNGVTGKVGRARRLADDIVRELVQ